MWDGVLRSCGITWAGKSGLKETLTDDRSAAMQLPKADVGGGVQHFGMVNDRNADFPAVRCGGSVCAAIARAFGMMGGKLTFAASVTKVSLAQYSGHPSSNGQFTHC